MNTHAINLRWLIQLRWGATLGQAVVILLVDLWLGIDLPVVKLLALVALQGVTNLGCQLWLRQRQHVAERVLAGLLAFDVLLLTALLQLSGGSFNPFNFLYLVHVALAAVVLRDAFTWGLALLSTACFGLLFLDPLQLGPSHMDHAAQMEMHLKGMWVAYVVAAAFIALFVGRIRNALRQRDRELEEQRQRTARSEKLASLATLAAGAAHELSTPLSTIAVAAAEIEQALARSGENPAWQQDATLIREQVLRCRSILDQMSTDAGDVPGETPVAVTVAELVAMLTHDGVAVRLAPEVADAQVHLPPRATAQALQGLIKNARDASSPQGHIELAAERVGDQCQIEVNDRGSGMPPEVLARAGEPFFTTKEPGRGMGLGLFLVHALADRLGGSFELSSTPQQGTTARFSVPLAVTNGHIAAAAPQGD